MNLLYLAIRRSTDRPVDILYKVTISITLNIDNIPIICSEPCLVTHKLGRILNVGEGCGLWLQTWSVISLFIPGCLSAAGVINQSAGRLHLLMSNKFHVWVERANITPLASPPKKRSCDLEQTLPHGVGNVGCRYIELMWCVLQISVCQLPYNSDIDRIGGLQPRHKRNLNIT